MKFIGLGHYSRVGKDTLANYIQAEMKRIAPDIRCVKVSLADKLKQVCHELYAWDGMREAAYYDTPEGQPMRDVKLPTIGKTPVEIWVAVGCAIREQVHATTWLDYVLKADHRADVVIVPDVRFPNEFEAFYNAEALMIQVVRPGYGPRKTKADRALLNESRWNYVVGGTGDLGELHLWARDLARATKFWVTQNTLSALPTQSHDERAWQLATQKIEPWSDPELLTLAV